MDKIGADSVAPHDAKSPLAAVDNMLIETARHHSTASAATAKANMTQQEAH